MPAEAPTVVVLLTPPGRGAVATLLVEGLDAAALVAKIFRPASGRDFASQHCGQIVFGRWGSRAKGGVGGGSGHGDDVRGSTGEEVVVCRTADDRVEIHCHGGQVAAAEITASLTDLGCEPRSWQSWLERGATDPIAAAAQLALSEATTERAAAVLLDQFHGALRRAVDGLLARLDAGDGTVAADLSALAATGDFGQHLTRPWHVVLAGPPNVGKSSLINALLGYQRAIVNQAPGTTRDVLSATTALEGWPVELFDTAGLRSATDTIEAAGIERASQRAASADLVLWVCDASQSWGPAETELATAWPRALTVLNKCDLASEDQLARHPHRTALRTIATSGGGIQRLVEEIARQLVPQPPLAGAAVAFTAAQAADLAAAAELSRQGDLRGAAALLRSRLLGHC